MQIDEKVSQYIDVGAPIVPTAHERIQVVQGDITQIDADLIVTAANSALRGGGGVDGAVHRAAGPRLLAASLALAPCPAGDARITDGFNLRARKVIHAVGPIFRELSSDREILAKAYQSSLSLAAEHAATSLAFPCISTGVYGFPQEPACDIAVTSVCQWLAANESPRNVIFCCFETQDFERYQRRLEAF